MLTDQLRRDGFLSIFKYQFVFFYIRFSRPICIFTKLLLLTLDFGEQNFNSSTTELGANKDVKLMIISIFEGMISANKAVLQLPLSQIVEILKRTGLSDVVFKTALKVLDFLREDENFVLF